MSRLRAFFSRTRALFGKRRLDASLDEEIRAHLEMLADDYQRQGLSPEEARYAAQRAFGGVEQVKDAYREARGLPIVEVLLQDLRHAVRVLRRSPVFTTVAVSSLALGIGANAAVFAAIDALLLRALPVAAPHELVALRAERKGAYALVSFPMYGDLRERQQVFTDILATAGETPVRATIPGQGAPRELDNVRISFVTGNFFEVLGVAPARGRFFTEADDRNPSTSETAGSVTVLSHDFWQRQFGGDPSVIGRTIVFTRSPCTIVGVAPRGFFGENVGSAPAAWVPLVTFSSIDRLRDRNRTFTSYMARLRPGIHREPAQAAMTVLFQQVLRDEKRVKDVADHAMVLEDGRTGLSDLRRTFARPLWLSMAMVALVLLIACANVGNLLLARAEARRKEIGVRLAIGCSRSRLVRQLLTESLLLSSLGALAGAAMAYLVSGTLLREVGFGPVPVQLALTPHWRVLLVLAALGLLTGIAFGLVPALQATRLDLTGALKAGARGEVSRRSRQHVSRSLVAAQIALSLLPQVAALLLAQTLRNLHHQDWGFRPEQVVLFDLAHNPPHPRDPAMLARVAAEVAERVRKVPGVDSASVSGVLPFNPSEDTSTFELPDDAPTSGEKPRARFGAVSPGYFETIGLTLLEGRGFEERDTLDAPRVAVVNQSLARRYLGGRRAVGRILRFAPRPAEIVGVVRDAKYNNLRADPKPMFYVPFAQSPRSVRSLEVRTTLTIAAVSGPVRQALAEASRDVMVRRVVTLTDQVEQSLAAERVIATLSGLFGALALLLACVGLYGVVSYSVSQRTSEIGVRMALGATGRSIVSLVMRDTFGVALAGVAIGVPLALAAARLVERFLYGLSAADPLTLALATLTLLGAAGLAAALPARRAARVDPMTALRCE